MINILLSGGLSLIFALIGTPLLIRFLTRRQYGQFIREDGPTAHYVKRGTPTMGGLVIVGAVLLAYGVTHLVRWQPPSLSGLLLLSGVSGLLGNVIAGKLIDRHLKGLIFAALLLSGGALALLGAARLAPLPFCFSGLLLALWGAGIAIVFVGLQTWLLRSAGAVAQPASAIYVAIFNAAIGTGAFVGGQLIASAGLSEMVWLAAGIMVGSTLLIALLKAPLPGQIGAATAGA